MNPKKKGRKTSKRVAKPTIAMSNNNETSETEQNGNVAQKKSPKNSERPQRKAVPALGILECGGVREKASDNRPTLMRTAPSLDSPDAVEVAFEDGPMEDGPTERPTKVEPRTRRVSDVVDCSGDGSSLPNSPRQTTFNEQNKSTMNFLPEWLKSLPESQGRINDSTDAAESREIPSDRTETDAVPFGQTAEPVDEWSNTPKSVYATMPVEKDSLEYNMNHARRGRAVIFNHDVFEIAGYGPRAGSDVDCKVLEETFRKLHFDVTVHNNLDVAKLMAVVDELKAEDHSDADCLMIAVLSHGMNGGWVLSKDTPYQVEKLWLSFKADVCPTLAGKPKLFFIQACRGEKIDPGVHMMRAAPMRTQTDSASSSYKIPSSADFLIAFSTVDGHYAWRNPEHGTWFIQCLCQELSESGTTLELLGLLTRTCRRVALDCQSYNDEVPWQHDMKQVPSINTMLIRDVYFRPKTTAMEVKDDV